MAFRITYDWFDRGSGKQIRVDTDYWFTSNPAHAAHWPSKEAADFECTLFNHFNIKIPSSQGGTTSAEISNPKNEHLVNL